MPIYQGSVEPSGIDSRQFPNFGLDYSRQGSVNRHTMKEVPQHYQQNTQLDRIAALHTSPLLSMKEAAHQLDISTDTLYRLIGYNKLRTIKIGKRRLVTPWALQEYVDTQERTNRLGGNYGF